MFIIISNDVDFRRKDAFLYLSLLFIIIIIVVVVVVVITCITIIKM